MVNAVLLAATPSNKREFIEGKYVKSFCKIARKYVFEHVLDSLLQSAVKDIIVIGPRIFKDKESQVDNDLEEILSSYNSDRISFQKEAAYGKPWERFLSNVQSAHESLRANDNDVIYVPSDIPLVRPKSIDDFVIDCMALDSNVKNDVYYCIIDNKLSVKEYPNHIRSGYSLVEGVFRPANLVLVKPSGIKSPDILAKAFIDSRKLAKIASKVRLAGYLGYMNTARHVANYFAGRASLKDVENIIGQAMGARIKLIRTQHAELEYDIDEDNDFYELKRIMEVGRTSLYRKVSSSRH